MMQVEVSYISAFLIGLLGGVHCVGMCGGIVGALGMGTAPRVPLRPLANLPIQLGYNLGRITSYTLAGALMGGIGALATSWLAIHQAQLVLQFIAGLFLLAMGLYLAGWWYGLARVERLGGYLWRRIEPLGRRLIPVQRMSQAGMLGLLWGWLPCGLVYSVLIWAISSGSAGQGALLMLSFGLGTLPNLLAMGLLTTRLQPYLQRPWLRKLAGSLVMAFGLLMLARSLFAAQ